MRPQQQSTASHIRLSELFSVLDAAAEAAESRRDDLQAARSSSEGPKMGRVGPPQPAMTPTRGKDPPRHVRQVVRECEGAAAMMGSGPR